MIQKILKINIMKDIIRMDIIAKMITLMIILMILVIRDMEEEVEVILEKHQDKNFSFILKKIYSKNFA